MAHRDIIRPVPTDVEVKPGVKCREFIRAVRIILGRHRSAVR